MNRWQIGSLELSLDDPGQAWQALEDIRRKETWGRLEAVEGEVAHAERSARSASGTSCPATSNSRPAVPPIFPLPMTPIRMAHL